ncbi:hypothetical protein HMPREF9306_00425 [Propionimicrobium lymphophilum ACS-093-V-SCH5]|uniref:IrrE N-terminal-like domain-containing protein n=1 Tax=Propionimicrobium lymphophilum ACS-093-V-SCH5 TaxID=883161 RepID=S2W601_9ACTN|nr:ImmA/IrrE family metallo-endopeptidase [Propionimicrobium lymphophilum]EPD33670.1 hypothetical protein HMPREF9306_00425 [Propionimicrobium lymphophilum ACS-093-V-SCH5]
MSLEPKYKSKEALDAKAESILAKYRNGQHLRAPKPLDVDDFAEFYLNATIDYQRLSTDGSILGMSVFQEMSTPVVNQHGHKIDISFPAQTIVIDHEALSDSPESRLRFTVAHECAHLILHQNIYYRDPSVRYANKGGYRPFTITSENAFDKDFNRAEFQANYLGAALLMPRDTFCDTYKQLVPTSWYELTGSQKRSVITNLADTFETSLTAVSIRIDNLKLAA